MKDYIHLERNFLDCDSQCSFQNHRAIIFMDKNFDCDLLCCKSKIYIAKKKKRKNVKIPLTGTYQ